MRAMAVVAETYISWLVGDWEARWGGDSNLSAKGGWGGGGDESDSPAIRKETAELADWASNLATQSEEKRRQKGKATIVIGDLELAITELLITKAFLLNFFPFLEYTWS